MTVASEMTASLTIKVKHDGEAVNFTSGSLIIAIKEALNNTFEEESEGIDIDCSIYVAEFNYDDNAESIRKKARRIIDEADPEELADILQKLKEQT